MLRSFQCCFLPLAGIGTGYSLMTGRLYDAQHHPARTRATLVYSVEYTYISRMNGLVTYGRRC